MKQIIAIFIGFFLATSLFSQTRVVYGKLTVYNTFPVQNVEVKSKKAKSAIRTDSLGQFAIICMEKDVIKIKPKTFQPVTRRIGPDTDSVSINLIFNDNPRNRELAVGYGFVNQEDLLYAVSNLEQENGEYCMYTNIFELLVGRFAGVAVNSGAVYIRGISSITTSNEALYVVDGVITTSIDWVIPCEIKSINILKDASSAIYGSRGANGVVLIETISGN